jgi:hypothetical protein
MKLHEMTIPYRLKTSEDILEAIRLKLIPDGWDDRCVLDLARRVILHQPPAMQKAKERISKQFIRIREEKIREENIQYKGIAHFDPVDKFPFIHRSISWSKEVAAYGDLFQFLRSLPQQVRDRCLPNPVTDSPTGMYDSIIAIRRLLKQEMLHYIKTHKTNRLTTEHFRRLLVAGTLFNTNNDDVLQALRAQKPGDAEQPLQKNALAELLFVRLPNFIKELFFMDPKAVRRRLFAKIAKLDMSNRQRASLHAYYRTDATAGDIIPILKRMDMVMKNMSLPPETKTAFHDYLSSLQKQIEHAPSLYRILFLGKELIPLQKFHKPGRVMTSSVSYAERIFRTYTVVTKLDLYPTKDFMDFFKGTISGDCTGVRLAEAHLCTPNFFNIRIFQDSGRNPDWIGNIYMLDFSEEYGSLLIDRIQIPRSLKAYYHGFCEHLRDALAEMFAYVDYRYLLIPLRISNHAAVQRVFNQYRKRLPQKVFDFQTPHAEHFESVRSDRHYCVFHEEV